MLHKLNFLKAGGILCVLAIVAISVANALADYGLRGNTSLNTKVFASGTSGSSGSSSSSTSSNSSGSSSSSSSTTIPKGDTDHRTRTEKETIVIGWTTSEHGWSWDFTAKVWLFEGKASHQSPKTSVALTKEVTKTRDYNCCLVDELALKPCEHGRCSEYENQ